MFGKCFLHRPVYSKTAVNVLPNRVLLKCSNCDTEHSVGQPCPAVWSGHFNLKDLGTALGNGARNCTTERDWGFLILTPQVQSGVFYRIFTNIALALFLLALSPIFMELPGPSSDEWSNNQITRMLLCSVCCACVGNCWGALPHTVFVLCSCSRFRCLTSVLISRLMSLCKELK